jgi:NTE family protein
VEKSWGPDYLRFGLGLGADLRGNTFFNMAASYRKTWINSLGGEWRTDAQLGRTSRLFTEIYQPVTTEHAFFVAPRAEAERRTVELFQGPDRIAAYEVRSTSAGIDFGVNAGEYGEARFGIEAGNARASLTTGPASLEPPTGTINQNAFRLRGIFDQLDSVNFPRFGVSGTAEIFAPRTGLGADQSYTKASLDLTGAYSIDRHTLQAALKLGGPLGAEAVPRYDLFQWGGFLQQSGYAPGQLLGERLTFGRVVYYYKVVDQQLFDGVYVGGSLEAGKMSHPLVPGSPEGVLRSGSLFVAIDTPIGPLYLGFGRAQDGNKSGYLYLGRP